MRTIKEDENSFIGVDKSLADLLDRCKKVQSALPSKSHNAKINKATPQPARIAEQPCAGSPAQDSSAGISEH